MRINKNTCITGKNVILVPYKKEHVLKYHEWMKSPELQHLTASEPLTLEQEYEMQKSWMEDNDKCTFIILDKDALDETNNEIDAMIGDTNLFFGNEGNQVAEAEIMIAETAKRGKKMGWEAMILMLRYGVEELSVKKFVVKIALDNEKSIKMFSKLNFAEVSRSEVFQEVTLEVDATDEWTKWLISESKDATKDKNYVND